MQGSNPQPSLVMYLSLFPLALLAFAACRASTPAVLSEFGAITTVRHDCCRSEPHLGIDIAADVNAPVVAAADGVVMQVYYRDSVGARVLMRHEKLLVFAGVERTPVWYTKYVHLSRTVVREGDHVSRGQLIGHVGLFYESGLIPHLHFELCRFSMCRESAVDPLPAMAECHSKPTSVRSAVPLAWPVGC